MVPRSDRATPRFEENARKAEASYITPSQLIGQPVRLRSIRAQRAVRPLRLAPRSCPRRRAHTEPRALGDAPAVALIREQVNDLRTDAREHDPHSPSYVEGGVAGRVPDHAAGEGRLLPQRLDGSLDESAGHQDYDNVSGRVNAQRRRLAEEKLDPGA